MVLAADVRDAEALEAGLRSATEGLGRLHGCVVNAGIWPPEDRPLRSASQSSSASASSARSTWWLASVRGFAASSMQAERTWARMNLGWVFPAYRLDLKIRGQTSKLTLITKNETAENHAWEASSNANARGPFPLSYPELGRRPRNAPCPRGSFAFVVCSSYSR